MARYEFVKGLPVITMAEGKQVGKVDDLVVDPESKAVRWLRLNRGGLLGGERRWISADTVHGLSEDGLTINSEADVLAPADAPEADALIKSKRRVIGSKVIDENGQRLGEVRDYEFAPDTFALTSLSVPESMNVVGPSLTIPAGRILTIGEDMMIVAASVVMEPAEEPDNTEELAS